MEPSTSGCGRNILTTELQPSASEHELAEIPSTTTIHSGPDRRFSAFNATDNDLIDKRSQDLASDTYARRLAFFDSSKHQLNYSKYAPATRRSDNIQQSEEIMPSAASNGFYPSFFRNPRHYLQPTSEDRFKAIAEHEKISEQSLLGSGDFGVLKGGTFYQNSEHPIKSYSEYYGINLKSYNGHQRPFTSSLLQKIKYPTDSSDPFSNFRDFADINISNDGGQYSELHIALANSAKSRFTLHKSGTDISSKEKEKIDPKTNEINKKYTKFNKVKLKFEKSFKQLQRQYELEPCNAQQKPRVIRKHNPDDDRMLALS
ncbi:uncharacterized protein LOC129727650 isoform X1 [Wyeomyia smithii]|uniref:uncharacterized protein LOC129727650 isoform X1 n=1 Tax=Wyeomyia smithii TaxID=174621 RepID=UPI002467D949|nr:uncharacterized protein LOC129727650 isoform X1 [Wyeomyia smithii]